MQLDGRCPDKAERRTHDLRIAIDEVKSVCGGFIGTGFIPTMPWGKFAAVENGGGKAPVYPAASPGYGSG
jgi:hypothetical protein